MSISRCFLVILFVSFFFFKQKTAYEMRISDWSSDVCSSDLIDAAQLARAIVHVEIGLEVVIAGLRRDRIAVRPAVIEEVAVLALRRAGPRGEKFVDRGQRPGQPLPLPSPQHNADRAFPEDNERHAQPRRPHYHRPPPRPD